MNPIKLFLSCFLLSAITNIYAQQRISIKPSSNAIASRTITFDDNWLFTKDSMTGVEQATTDNTNWRTVDLPHDWSIEDLPAGKAGLSNQKENEGVGPFSKMSAGGTSTGFVIGGTGWYKKKFVLDKNAAEKIATIHFDGVYMNSDVWLNGHHLGNHPYGYTPFYYELTKWLKPTGEENTLVVRVRNEGKNSRWYSGSGIYRHVWVTVTNPLHIVPWGVYITTPQISPSAAIVHIKTTLKNEKNVPAAFKIITHIIYATGREKRRTESKGSIEPNTTLTLNGDVKITAPQLWSLEAPVLYTAITEVYQHQQLVDRTETPFGIRTISFSAQNGFTLNGKKVLIKGGCIHHDNGPLGAATIDRAEERKIEILKKNGFNAIRTSHNPPSKQLLDACDRLGMVVIDEAFDMWERPKNPQDYYLYFKEWWQRDIDAMVLRDRNHPSVILWSIGNEVNERADTSGLAIAKKLVAEVRLLDTTRPVTEAICGFWDHPGRKWEATAPVFALLDVGGYNYEWKEYEKDHKKYPERIMIGTETFPLEAYENWQQAEKHSYVLGDFVWTAMDYMGETGIGHAALAKEQKGGFLQDWPWFNAYCGDIDLIGFKKPQSYYRDVVWRRSKIEMAVHNFIPDSLKEYLTPWGWPDEQQSWTWPGAEGKPLQVRIFSRSPLITLELNGKIIGEQKIDTGITALFEVPYQPGILKAIAVEDGKEVAAVQFKTAGTPKQIRLSADRSFINANRNDLSYVTVEVIDEDGTIVPNANIPVHFSISGRGELAGVGNANPADMSSFQQPQKNTFRGRCLAIVRPKGNAGTIKLTASAEGLQAEQVVITTK